MSPPLSKGEIGRFRALIVERLGLQFDDDRLADLERVLRARVGIAGDVGVASYLDLLASPTRARDELRVLAIELTIGETYFFRDPAQLHALAEVVVPALAGRGALRILSAGCATGEEAYSIAMVLRDRLPLVAAEAQIRGIDANVVAIQRALAARYSEWSLRETSPETRARHFRTAGRELELDESVRRTVSFEERNLVVDDAVFWGPEAFDVVFCRNVIMYLSPTAVKAIVARIARSLSRGGYLFLGHAETLRGISEDYDLCHTHETFYYRRRAAPERRAGRAPDHAGALAVKRASGLLPPPVSGPRGSDAGSPRGEPGPLPNAPMEPGGMGALRAVTDLLEQERFAEALARLRALPPASLAGPRAQLLLALLLTNTGDLHEAEAVLQRLLDVDRHSADAHYLRALCRERAGDPEAAVRHDRLAASLDPSFAMPRLHLGLLAKRAGDTDTARAEMRRALALLAGEDVSRLLLFGGGFHRDALVNLCRAELRVLGVSDE